MGVLGSPIWSRLLAALRRVSELTMMATRFCRQQRLAQYCFLGDVKEINAPMHSQRSTLIDTGGWTYNDTHLDLAMASQTARCGHFLAMVGPWRVL